MSATKVPPHSLLKVIRQRNATGRGFAAARGKGLAYTDAKAQIVGNPEEDQRYQRFVVCTRDPDRSGDIMEPKGCLKFLDRWRRNPVWFYEHYLNPDKNRIIRTPIGKGDGPAGTIEQLDFEVSDDQIVAGCWFTDATAEGRDIWRMVQGKFLRTTSIAFLPHRAVKLKNFEGYHFLEWELTEISIVGVPDNFNTGLADGAGAKSIAGFQKRLQGTVSGLESAVLRKSWSSGVTLGEKAMADKKKEDEETPDQETGPGANDSQADDANETVEGDTTPEQAQTDKEGKDEEETERGKSEEDAVAPPGALTLRDVAKHDIGVHNYIKAMLGHNENEHVVGYLKSRQERHEADLTDLKSIAGKAYPDIDFEKMLGEGGEGQETQQDEADPKPEKDTAEAKGNKGQVVVKRLNASCKACIKEAKEFLEEAGGHEAIPKSLRSGHKYHAKALGELLTTAQPGQVEQKDEGGDEDDGEEMQKNLDSIRAFCA